MFQLVQFGALCKDVYLQAKRNYVLIIILLLTLLMMIVFYSFTEVSVGEFDSDELAFDNPLFHISTRNPERFMSKLLEVLIGTIISVGYSLAIFAFSSFIPTTVAKGSADLILSKPLLRAQILFSRIAIIFVLFASLTGAFFFGMLGLGYWLCGETAEYAFISYVFMLIGFMPILAGIILLNVLTRSSVITVVLSIVAYPSLALINGYKTFEDKDMGFWYLVNAIIPQYAEMVEEITDIADGRSFDLWPFGHSMIIAGVVFLIAFMVFQRRNYTS